MDADLIIFLIIVAFSLLSSLLSWLTKKLKAFTEQQQAPPQPPQPRRPRPQRTPPAPAPRPGLARPQPAPAPVRPRPALARPDFGTTAAEHTHAPGWHERSAADTTRTASEHEFSPGWHERSEMGGSRAPQVAVKSPTRSRSSFGRDFAADLHGDASTLSRLLVWREILGPPVSLRRLGEGPRFEQ